MSGATSRDVVLDRIRAALADRAPHAAVDRAYRAAGASSVSSAELVEVFADRLRDYRATVRVCAPDDLPAELATALSAARVRSAVVPDGFPAALLGVADVNWLRDDPPLSAAALADADIVLTTCALAIAETGTIVLDHGAGQGRRALTLVPDRHLVVIGGAQILAAVPDAIAALDPVATQTWISGPSATSDIELSRVEGVHGPRNLHVLIA